MTHNQSFKWFFPALLLLAAACEPKVDNRGYVSSLPWKEHIAVGTSTRDDVLATFGSPSVQSSFGEETWYYVSSRKEATAFFKPEIVEQSVVRLTFDTNGVVSHIEAFDKENSKDFAITKRVTPTEGHELGFIEQLLGNIGRFNKPGGSDSVAPGRQPGSGGL